MTKVESMMKTQRTFNWNLYSLSFLSAFCEAVIDNIKVMLQLN